jgi:hypothetical protein
MFQNIFMKKNILLIGTLFFIGTLHAQVKKVYGFVQHTQGGAIQDDKTGNKNYAKEKTGDERYFVFIEIKKNTTACIQQVWIKGIAYTFKPDTIRKFPVIHESPNGGEMIPRDTLIKSSREQVIQLMNLTRSNAVKALSNTKRMIAANSIVIIYKSKGKTSAVPLKNLTELHALFTQ